jgi:Tol biopolymer transport system component
MTSEQRFERDLPALLADVGLGPRPDYRDDIVRQTATMRQRPAWTLPERWLPMSVLSTRVASPPRVPLRLLAVAALLIVAIVGVLLVVGSRSRVPAPFGVAANGLVAFSLAGDIYTVDPSGTTSAKAVVTGNDDDSDPAFSLDGTKMVFLRASPTDPNRGRLVVASVDGSHQMVITPDPLQQPARYSFSPDGNEIAFTTGTNGDGTLWIARTDGSATPREIKVDMQVKQPVWAPPDGREIVFASVTPDGTPNGLFAVDVHGGQVRTILGPVDGVGRDVARVSPDGSRLAYSASSTAISDHNSYVVHVVGIDGSGDITLPMPPRATFQDQPVWSNDGKRLAVTRGYAAYNEEMAVAILPADGSRVGIETTHGISGCCDNILDWSPADTSILFHPDPNNGGTGQQILIDPDTGATTQPAWAATSLPAWQRVAR